VVDKSERIAAIVYCADTSNEGHLGHPGRVLENVKILAEASKGSRKPYYLMSSRPGLMNTQQAKAMRDAGLVQIGGTRQGLGALDRVGRYVMGPRPARAPAQARSDLAELLTAQPERRTINEFDSKRLLSSYGVPVTRERRIETLAEANDAARDIGFPVVLKVVSDAIPHKTELGLVAVGLKSEDELAHAYAKLDERLGRVEPRPQDAAFLLQEMVADGVEVFAGISRDPDFGLSMAFGLGGTAIEITRDFALRMLPLREGDAEAMIAETRAAAILGSVRGRPAADVKSLVACLYALSDFARDNADRLAEVDLNPIKALPEGRGCAVVDALIVIK
jgi:acyl-CoA synthetase (NDP forming)